MTSEMRSYRWLSQTEIYALGRGAGPCPAPAGYPRRAELLSAPHLVRRGRDVARAFVKSVEGVGTRRVLSAG
jgi:hypothetical protein